jgi:hypothetical protein
VQLVTFRACVGASHDGQATGDFRDRYLRPSALQHLDDASGASYVFLAVLCSRGNGFLSVSGRETAPLHVRQPEEETARKVLQQRGGTPAAITQCSLVRALVVSCYERR